MRLNCMRLIVLVNMLLWVIAPATATAQEDGEWNHKTTNSGMQIKYRYDSRTNADGDDQLVVKYEAIKTVEVDIDKAAAFLNTGSNYQKFLDHVEETKNVGSEKGDGWFLYQYIDPPWPMPEADCVQQVEVISKGNEVTVTLTTATDAYELKDVDRMELSDMTIKFKRLKNGSVEINIYNHFAPVGSPPKFLMNTWFPGGPEKMIDRLVEQINKM